MRKIKTKYLWSILLPAVLTLVWTGCLLVDALKGNVWGSINDLVTVIICALITWGSLKLNTEKDDERDQFIEAKTGQQMYQVAYYLVFGLGVVSSITATFLFKTAAYRNLAFALVLVSVILLLIWLILTIVELVLSFVNYHQN
jgi:hypothetical protein